MSCFEEDDIKAWKNNQWSVNFLFINWNDGERIPIRRLLSSALVSTFSFEFASSHHRNKSLDSPCFDFINNLSAYRNREYL